MSTVPPTAPKRRRWLLVIAGFIALAASVPFAVPAWQNWRIDCDLAAAVAETDRLDPGWRMEEMRAKREAIADDENAAWQIQKVGRLLPDKTYYPQFRDLTLPEGMAIKSDKHHDWIAIINDSLDNTPDTNQLSILQIAALASEWKQHRHAIKEACKLCEYKKCRFDAVNHDGKVAELQASRAVGGLLRVAILHQCHAGMDEDAQASLRALIKLAHFQTDELSTSMQLCRLASLHTLCVLMSRMLGQGAPRAETLAEFQAGMEEIEKASAFSTLARAYRAEGWQLYRDAQEAPDETRRMMTEVMAMSWVNAEPEEPAWYLRWFVKKRLPDIRVMQANEMRLANRALEFAKKSVDDQGADFAKFVKEKEAAFPDMKSAAVESLAKSLFRVTMELRTTRTAIALERYRQATGDWPTTLDQLVPAYLADAPFDLYSSKPLIYRRVDRGVIVYSVGQDRIDNDGKLRADQDTIGLTGLDSGVRLWDVEHRRQPPLPPRLKGDG